MRFAQNTTREFVYTRYTRRSWWCTCTALETFFPTVLTDRGSIDLRRVPYRSPSPTPLLLRHRRMFPLARLHPPLQHHLSPLKSAPTTLSSRHRNRIHGPFDHHRVANTDFLLLPSVSPISIFSKRQRA